MRSAVIGNAGTLVVFRVGSRDAELLAPEFRPMDPGALADQEPFTAWLRRGIGRDRIFAEPQLYEPLGTAAADPRAEPPAASADTAPSSSVNVSLDLIDYQLGEDARLDQRCQNATTRRARPRARARPQDAPVCRPLLRAV